MSNIRRFLPTLTATVLLAVAGTGYAVPECSYADEPAILASYDEWPFTLVDTIYRLPADYVPPDLVPLTAAGFSDERLVRELMIADLAELRQDADALGHPVEVQSAYRSFQYQEQTFAFWVAQEGREAALKSSARPGHSEHQLGTTIDLRSAGGPAPWDLADWADTPAGAWLTENSWRYGFVLSYPRDRSGVTCYIYEPWHYRYVGREVAAAVHESGLTLREWLWQYHLERQQPD